MYTSINTLYSLPSLTLTLPAKKGGKKVTKQFVEKHSSFLTALKKAGLFEPHLVSRHMYITENE